LAFPNQKKPARIPPQTPPAGGQNPQIRNQSRKSEIQIPKKLFSLFRVQIQPRQLPESLKAEHQKQNFLFHLREILPRAKSENVKKIFCFWCPPR
jgi:hypothetical protein